jgi:hypothetical protein
MLNSTAARQALHAEREKHNWAATASLTDGLQETLTLQRIECANEEAKRAA